MDRWAGTILRRPLDELINEAQHRGTDIWDEINEGIYQISRSSTLAVEEWGFSGKVEVGVRNMKIGIGAEIGTGSMSGNRGKMKLKVKDAGRRVRDLVMGCK
jgi:hypothetical protein